jgi:hypothetical protein
MLHIAFSLF